MSAGEVIEGARRRPRGGRYRKSSIGATATWPLAARAQQTMPVVGFLSSGSHAARSNLLPFFSRGMSEIGYIEGRNVVVEYRWAQGRNDQLPSMAADLVRRRVSAIAAFGYPPVLAAAMAGGSGKSRTIICNIRST